MNQCLTKPITDEFSGCLTEKPDCSFAVKFGFSYHCTHPSHLQWTAKAVAAHGRFELLRKYLELRELRRKKFTAELGMPVQECVSRLIDIVKQEYPEEKGKPRRREPMGVDLQRLSMPTLKSAPSQRPDRGQ